jgi:hypothetical protein
MRNATLLFVGAGWLLASCRQSGSPTSVPPEGDQGGAGGPVGVYVLRSLAGSPPPVVANQAANLVAIADTIRLRPGGTGVETGVELAIDETLPEGEIKRHYRREFSYRLSGDRIEVDFPCPTDALILCIAPPHYVGRLTAGGLELDYALYYRTPLLFDRVGN